MDAQRAKIKQRPSFGMAFMVNCGAVSNLIRVDMPEVLGDLYHKVCFNPVLGDPVIVFRKAEDGGWFYEHETPSLAVRGTMAFGEDTLSMSLSVKNTGREPLEDVCAQIC